MNATTMKATTTRRSLLLATALLLALGTGLYFFGVWPRANARMVREPVSQSLGSVR